MGATEQAIASLAVEETAPGFPRIEIDLILCMFVKAIKSRLLRDMHSPGSLDLKPRPQNLWVSGRSDRSNPLILLFDPRREHSSIPTGNSHSRRDAGPVKAGSIFAATRRAWP
jgi:hypothetical protein